MTDALVHRRGMRRRPWLSIYLVSLALSVLFEALLNAPSGYAPYLCGAAYQDVPCVSYSWLDSFPDWVGAILWFLALSVNVVGLVLLFKCGSTHELGWAIVWVLALLLLGGAFIALHHWHMVVRDFGSFLDLSNLHRWDVLGLLHNGVEYTLVPLGLAGLVFLIPTWFIRRRRERRAIAAQAPAAVTS